jgi:3-deoxy-7-phosphoheptulonate synthase
VERVTPISKPYKLTNREFHPEDTVIRVLDAVVGDGSLTVMAGPCSVESREQVGAIAASVVSAGARVLRGGAYKPRTSPYSFQGARHAGLEILARVRREAGIAVVTEALDPRDVEAVGEVADVFQVGSRNMSNQPLLAELGRQRKPVLLKRGFAATLREFLLAAEFVLAGGNEEVVLCERGIRGFDTSTRFTLDLNAVPLVRGLSHLPVIVDPSHGTGRRELVERMALAGIAAGAHGLIVEVHPQPDAALCDSAQTIAPVTLARIITKTHMMAELLNPASLEALPLAAD